MSRASESAPAPGGVRGVIRRGAEAGLHDIAKSVVIWLGAALGAVLVSLIPPVRAFLAHTSLTAWWMLPIAVLGALAGAALERWLLARRIHTLETEKAKLIEERQARRLHFRSELEEQIAKQTRKVRETEARVLDAQRWEQRLSVAALAIDKLDHMARERGAVLVNALSAELEDCVIREMRHSTDVLFRLGEIYWLVMPYQKQASAMFLPKRIHVSIRLMSVPNIPGLPGSFTWTISAGVAELKIPDDPGRRDDLDRAVKDVVNQAEGALRAALQLGGRLLTPDDIAASVPSSV